MDDHISTSPWPIGSQQSTLLVTASFRWVPVDKVLSSNLQAGLPSTWPTSGVHWNGSPLSTGLRNAAHKDHSPLGLLSFLSLLRTIFFPTSSHSSYSGDCPEPPCSLPTLSWSDKWAPISHRCGGSGPSTSTAAPEEPSGQALHFCSFYKGCQWVTINDVRSGFTISQHVLNSDPTSYSFITWCCLAPIVIFSDFRDSAHLLSNKKSWI